MFKKSFICMLLAVFILPMAVTLPVQAADKNQVCGLDGKNYKSAEDAAIVEVDVAYNFACVNPAIEKGLYEAKSDIAFAGMLVEVGSTDVPTNLIIRSNKDGNDYTVAITASTTLGERRGETSGLSDWIPGDQIKISGTKNENTGNIDATKAVNLSINLKINKSANGWISKIDKEAKKITYKWADKEFVFSYDEKTKFVVGLKNPAAVDDLAVNDRIRARLVQRSGQDPLAKIVVVLRRGNDLFMKIRTFTPRGTLVRLDSVVVPTTIQIKVEKTPGLKAGDVNNLIGGEGRLITVNITENTVIVRKYFGRATLDEFAVGDDLVVVGRVNDDGTMDAKLLKNNSIWKTSIRGHAGIVKEVNLEEKYLMVEWTPIVYLNSAKLKEALKSKSDSVAAQSISTTTAQNAINERVSRIKEKIAEELLNLEKRIIKYKKIVINRIKHDKVAIGDLIKRKQPQDYKVIVDEKTKIVVGTNVNATISDIKAGDKVRIRGIRNENVFAINAETIVVVNYLPEIEEPLATAINDINELASEIVSEESAIAPDTTTETEQEVDGN